MARFRLDSIAQLTHQMEFAPQEVRVQQLAAAEDLLHIVDPSKAYPHDFVIYKITGYRPKEDFGGELLTGLALQHDLGLLVERVSDALNLRVADLAEPVLSIDDLTERFNVTSKTIQRWRRRGLPARRFIFADDKKRVGFLLSSVERFVAQHQDQVSAAANFSQVTEAEREEMLRRARRLAERCHCCVADITRRVARHLGRSPLTVLHTIRKHDQENPGDAIFARATEPISDADRVVVLKAHRRGVNIKAIASRVCRPRTAVYRIILDERLSRLLKRKVRFHDDALYHQDDAAAVMEALVAGGELPESARREDTRVPRDLPPYMQALYRTPLLTPAQERALFLKFNYQKYLFVQARKRIEPDQLRNRDINRLETLLTAAQETKNRIVQANLRLVVSVARKHLRSGVNMLELVSDGNLTLMRAVEGFDVHRGHRFSTYATLALMKGFARSVPKLRGGRSSELAAGERLAEVVDLHSDSRTDDLVNRDEVVQLLSRLDDREREVLTAHFGLNEHRLPATYEQVGERLGLSKERVRQIEQHALEKLRAVMQG